MKSRILTLFLMMLTSIAVYAQCPTSITYPTPGSGCNTNNISFNSTWDTDISGLTLSSAFINWVGPAGGGTMYYYPGNPGPIYYAPAAGDIGGTFSFTIDWTFNTCATVTSNVVTFTVYNTTVPNAGTDQLLCNVTGTTLVGNTPTSGAASWSYVSGGGVPATVIPGAGSVANVTFNDGNPPAADYTYTFRYSITNGGCTLTDDILVTNYRPPFTPYAGPDQDICFATNPVNVTMAADAVGYGTGTWSQVAGPAFSIPVIDLNNPTAVFALTAPGQYGFVWTTTNGVCTPATDNVDIRVWAPVTADAGGDVNEEIEVCFDATSTPLNGTNTGDVYAQQWQSSGDGTFNNPYLEDPTYTFGPQDILDIQANLPITLIYSVDGYTPCSTETDEVYIVLEDNAPVVVTQNITVDLDAITGTVSILPSQIENGSTDDCTIVDYALDITDFDCGDVDVVYGGVGPITVVLSVTDNAGNVGSASATVTVRDVTDPTAQCKNYTAVLDDVSAGTGAVTIAATDVDDASFDNCSIDTRTLDISSFTCADLGDNTVVLTVEDPSNNSSSCSATVTVVDNSAPHVITQNITVTLSNATPGLGSVSIVAADVNNGSWDNCSIASMSLDKSTFDCSNVDIAFGGNGPVQVVLTVTDGSGNAASATAMVTVLDSDVPTAVCQNITVQLDDVSEGTGSVTISPLQVDNGSYDNCSVASFTLDITLFDCTDLGANTVELTATDPSGNASTCTATVTVEDVSAPHIVCQDITVNLSATAPGVVSIVATDLLADYWDNCTPDGSLIITASRTDFDCADVIPSPISVIVTVTDGSGNSSSCEAFVTVNDITTPTITYCVSDIAQDNDAGDCGAIVYYGVDPFIPWGDITAKDNCATNFALLSGYYNGDFFPVGTTTVTWEVSDNDGNSATCTFDVVITDAEPPVIICPPDITANNDPGDCFAIIDIDTPYNTDNCAVDYVTNDAPAQYPAGNPATTVVTWTAVDIHGNVSTCTQNIIVYDVEAPIITTCPADRDVNINTNSGCEITIPALVGEVVATENCVIASVTQVPAALDIVATAHNATTAVTITVADINGNSTTCVVTLTAKDITAPNAYCANYTAELDITGNVSITPANVDDGSWDNCGIVSWNVSPSSFTCNELGANTVTLTLEDAAGNISTCTSTVTVVDYIAPDAVCVPFTAYLDATGNVTIAATDVDGGSTDNCTIASMVVSPDAFTCTELGANLVTLSVTDQSGNVGTCQTTVTVVDAIAPNAVCQAYTAVLDATGNVTITAVNVDGGSSDNCTIASMLVAPDAFTCADLGDNDVVLTVTDQSGNVATCVAVVTVVDNMAPTTLCKDITVYLDGNGEADITPMMIDNGSYDNCSIVNYALDVTHFECDVDLGPNPVILTVTDQSGNSETCSATVTVVDNIPPVITCPANVLTCSLPNESLDYTPVYDINPTITDNCSFTYSYTTSGATTISGTGDASGRDFNVGITTVLYTVIDAGGNVSTCAFDIEVIEYQAADAGPAVLEACNTEFVLLLGNIPTPGTSLWYQDMTTGAPAATITQVLNEAYADDLVAGYTYKFVYQIDNGPCTSDDTITYNNWLPASASLAGFDQELCNATSFTLAGNTPAVGQGTWIQISGPSCTFTDVNNPAMEVTGVTPGQYAFVWQIVNGPVCPPENDEVLITVYPMVTVNAGADDIVCPNAGYYEVTGATAANYSSLFWQATGTGYFDNVTVTNPKYYFSAADIAQGSVTLMLHGYGLGPCPDVMNEMVLTINDFTPPVIATCAPAQNVNLNATCGLVVPDLTAAVVATDNCNDIVITQSPAAGSVLASAHNQTHVVTITVTDIRNNTATCMVTLTGLDVTAPVISVCAPAQNVNLNATCQVVVPNLLPAVTASDNCTYTLTQSPVAGTALASAHNSTHTVVITATDAAGLTATCSVVLTAKDVTAPVITVCPAPQNVNLSGSCSITVPNLVALTSATDNCTYTITQAPAATTILASAHNQVHNVTISATDAAGNVTTCVVALTAKDVTNPAFTGCPANITVNNTPGQCGATVSWTAPTPTDNCVGVTSVQTAGLASGSFFPYGTTTITYTATDLAGLTAVCTFTVTVNDNQNPTIGCVANVVQDNDPGMCSAIVNGIDPVNPWDNCPGYVVTYTRTGVNNDGGTGSASGLSFDKGVTTVTYTITDHVGRTANCSFTVTIEDNEGPAITCPELAIYDNTPGMCVGIGLVLDAPVVMDNCSSTPSIVVTNNAPAIYVLGNNYVTWTATDLEGNVTTCVQVVQVIDTEVPTITCPANITVNAGDPIDLGMPVTDDNCWVASIANNAPVTFPVGVTTVTWTVTDGVFNTATCTQTVTVVDPLAPVYTLGGRFSYANTVGSPMNNAPVALKENGTVVATTVTDANGEYQFTAVEPGTYTVEGASTTEWGGANATDALLVMKHFTQVITLVGLPKDAGDVNANGFINSLDALLIAKRFVSQITSFPSGDWTADAPVVELNSNTITDFNALCMGDVNASYVPSTKSEPTVSMNVEGVKYITANETFELPVYTNHSLNTGAISMVINYASDIFDVVGVRIADVDGGNLVYSALNNEIRIAWFNNVPAVFNSNEAVVILSLRAKSEGDATFTLDGISEIANANAQVEYAALTMPKVAFTSNAFAVNVYPNPFKHNTEFTYTLPTDSKVSLVVYDILGNEVASILNGVEQTANTYKLTFDASNLKQGVYTYKLMVGNQTKVGRLVINR